MEENREERARAALDAMEHHQANVTYPIMYDLDDRLCILGSGVLFAYEEQHFVVTAAHLFDHDEDIGSIIPERLAGPNKRGYGVPTTFGPICLYTGERDPFDFDIAAIALRDAQKIAAIKNGWQFLGVTDLGMPTCEPHFLLGGYPRDLQAQRGGTTHGPLFVAHTLQLAGIPDSAKPPVDLRYDYFGEYASEGLIRKLDNKVMQSPALKGVSGGSLFQYDDTTTGLWSVSKTMKLVGIQSGASTAKKWFRAKKSNVIALLFEQIDPKIGTAIHAVLGDRE